MQPHTNGPSNCTSTNSFCHSPRSRMCAIPQNRVFHHVSGAVSVGLLCEFIHFLLPVTECPSSIRCVNWVGRHALFCPIDQCTCMLAHKPMHALRGGHTHDICACIHVRCMCAIMCNGACHGASVSTAECHSMRSGFSTSQHASLARASVRFPGHFSQKVAPCNRPPALLASLWDLTQESNPRP